MKPGSRDRKYSIKFTGAELTAFKEVCSDLPESFGLDSRIAAYQGTRPIGFWPWDLDGLVARVEHELQRPPDARKRRRRPKIKRQALESVYRRLLALHEEAYREQAKRSSEPRGPASPKPPPTESSDCSSSTGP